MKKESKLERIGKEKSSPGNVLKTIPHLATSIIITPIVFPYSCFVAYLNSFASPVDGYAADLMNDFF